MSLIHLRLVNLLRKLDDTITTAQAKETQKKRLWKEFSFMVRKARLRNGLTLEELAKLTGIGKGTLFYLEHNDREWTLERARLVTKALK